MRKPISKKIEILHFVVRGEFVTNLAREWLYAEQRPYAKVLNFLTSSMAGTDLDESTIISFAHDVLLGRRKLIGNTADNSYGLVDDNVDIVKLYPLWFK